MAQSQASGREGRDIATQDTLAALSARIDALAQDRARVIVAIAGPPASGKSTFAQDLCRHIGRHAAVLPMDGFHLDNATLQAAGLLARKGAPETFDAAGFAALLAEVRRQDSLRYPTFDRAADRTVPDGGLITAQTRVVLAEGNYLLLNQPPWAALAGMFDLSIALQVDTAVLQQRLEARWRDHGLDAQAARARALGNDMKNAQTVAALSRAADVTLRDGAPV